MGPRNVNFTEEDNAILNKLNGLLEQLHVSNRVNAVPDIGASVFVTLFEGLCGEQLPGIIRSPSTREDEVHNCQIVIDSLSGEILHTSLTHISGAEIIDGNREAILNMTEIFSGLLEYMLNRIESEASFDHDDDEQNLTSQDPDLVTPDIIDEILDAELQRDRILTDTSAVKSTGPTARWVQDCSPSRDPELKSFQEDTECTKDSQDTTADLIQESEEIERQLKKSAQLLARVSNNRAQTSVPTIQPAQPTGAQPQPFSRRPDLGEPEPASIDRRVPYQGTGTKLTHGTTEDKTKNGVTRVITQPADKPDDFLSRERERRADIIKRLENDPRYKYMLPPSQSDTAAADEEVDETFKSLQNMVEETAAMAREAVNCSPGQAQSMLQTLERQRRAVAAVRPNSSPSKSPFKPAGVTERSRRDRATQDTRSSRSGIPKRPSPSGRKASSKPTEKLSDTELSPSRAKRKVSFMVERSLTDSSPSIDQGRPTYSRPVTDKRSAGKHSGSYLSYDDKENQSYDDVLRKQYQDIVADTLSDEEGDREFGTAGSYRKSKYSELSSRPKALYSVEDTKKLVQGEKEAGKKKIGFLQKIYREDLDELLDEADYLMDKNREAAREREKAYRKKVLAGVKSKPEESKTGPSVLKKKTRRVTPCVSSKIKRTPSNKGLLKPDKKPLTIKDDEDILPLLLEEFPHLHLSLHTWHELWRKGLNQIETVTRAHQEVRRKKSQAQNQLEEAEKRQEILVNIMKKELEHNARLKEIKDRKSTAISTKNKLHERRMQSARSRHYYDEYQVRMRSKMLKRRTREEMVFKKLFKDGLEIQKERIRELRKYATEQRDSQARVQRDEIESMENYYRDQFNMLAENISKEKKDLELREKAQQKVMESMKKELRKKMEKEINTLQEQLVRDDDDAYFRQLDADRVIHDLQMAKYQVQV